MDLAEKNVRKILRRAKKLIEGGWTRGNYAVYKDGREVGNWATVDPDKARFCLIGALDHACLDVLGRDPGYPISNVIRQRVDRAIESTGSNDGITAWNDSRKSKKPVLEVLDKAIGT